MANLVKCAVFLPYIVKTPDKKIEFGRHCHEFQKLPLVCISEDSDRDTIPKHAPGLALSVRC